MNQKSSTTDLQMSDCWQKMPGRWQSVEVCFLRIIIPLYYLHRLHFITHSNTVYSKCDLQDYAINGH